MITLFATLKPPISPVLFKTAQKRAKEQWKRAIAYDQYRRDIAIIQGNALESWARLKGDPEVILFGDEKHEPGTRALAKRYGFRHFPVKRNQWGTPLVGALIAQSRKHAKNFLLCLINADIVLMDDFIDAVDRVSKARKMKPFVMSGGGHNLDNPPPLEFGLGWQKRLSEFAKAQCEVQPPSGMDFWVHTRPTYEGLDFGPMAIGRYKWDNCMMALPKKKGVPIIDATGQFVVIRQRDNIKFPRTAKEAMHNTSWGGERCAGGRLTDADWKLTAKGLVRK